MRRYAFLFPGQGSQHPGMGSELAESFPEARAAFAEADEALGSSLSEMCFGGSESDLARTETTQPAVLAVSIAALRPLLARGLMPVAAAGHSLGEYTAHVAAGTIGFREALTTVRLRGRFMQEAVPLGTGAMSAIIGIDADTVGGICKEAEREDVVEPANLNAPAQTVIAGHKEAVARASEMALARGASRAIPLTVSAPFHCRLMRPAAERLAPVLSDVPFSSPRFPVYTNVDAARTEAASDARAALVRQVASVVRWQQLIEAMADDGIDTFVEVGPGKVLTGLVRRIRKGLRVLAVSDPAGVESAVAELGESA